MISASEIFRLAALELAGHLVESLVAELHHQLLVSNHLGERSNFPRQALGQFRVPQRGVLEAASDGPEAVPTAHEILDVRADVRDEIELRADLLAHALDRGDRLDEIDDVGRAPKRCRRILAKNSSSSAPISRSARLPVWKRR